MSLANKILEQIECDALKTALSDAPLCFWVKDYTDGVGIGVYVNKTFEQTYGIPASDYIGRQDADIFPEQAPEWEETDRRALEAEGAIQCYVKDVNHNQKQISKVYKWRVKSKGRTYVAGFTFPGVRDECAR